KPCRRIFESALCLSFPFFSQPVISQPRSQGRNHRRKNTSQMQEPGRKRIADLGVVALLGSYMWESTSRNGRWWRCRMAVTHHTYNAQKIKNLSPRNRGEVRYSWPLCLVVVVIVTLGGCRVVKLAWRANRFLARIRTCESGGHVPVEMVDSV